MRISESGKTMFTIAACFLMGCGGSSTSAPNRSNNPAPPPPGTPNSVVVTNNTFTPGGLTTTAGATVTWTWNSCTGGDGYGNGDVCTAHNILFDDGATSGAQSAGTYDRTFATKGTFPYHCRIHGAAMSGSVVVQ